MMMASRLLLCHELLKDTGSMFLHCDHSANNYLRTLLDMIFGKKNFRNEIIWHYPNRLSQKGFPFPKMHDTILCYSKTDDFARNELLVKDWEVSRTQLRRQKKGYEYYKGTLVVYDERKARDDGIDLDKVEFKHGKTGRKRINSVMILDALNSMAKERTGKPTQKPVALYSRLILASTGPGDLVIDPFCGCATTLVAAENAGRQWIGIDINPTTEDLVLEQLDKLNENSLDFWRKNIKFPKSLPRRTDNKLSSKELNRLKENLMVEQLKHRPYLICAICDHPKDHFDLEVDHKHPKANRGGNELKNLQLLCCRCNRRKGGTKTNEQVRSELKTEDLLYEQRLKVHDHMKTLTPSQKDHLKGLKQRKKPRWKEDLERKKASRQPEMGL